MDIDHPTPSAPRLPVEVAVPPADPNHVTEGRDDEPVTPDLSCPFCKWEDEEVGLRSGIMSLLVRIVWGGTSATSTSRSGMPTRASTVPTRDVPLS